MKSYGKIKAALFDLDGVVFDTEPQYTVFWGKIAREYHPELPGLEHLIKGQTLTQIYDRFFSDAKDIQSNITQRLNAYELKMKFDYVRGFTVFVNHLRKQGIKTAVVTSSNRPKMESVYHQHLEFKSLFDVILTSENFSESKPSPECYIKAIEYFGIQPFECIVFEDSFNGLKSGKASGAFVVGISTTNTPDDIQPFCDAVVANYEGLTIEKLSKIIAISK